MADSPYTPPGSRVADRERVARPRQVSLAVTLLWVSYAIGFPSYYLGAAREPEMGSSVILGVYAVFCVLAAALIVLVHRGHNWARILTALLVALTGIVLLTTSEEPAPGALERVLDIVSFVLELAALYLLFSRPAALWFRPRE